MPRRMEPADLSGNLAFLQAAVTVSYLLGFGAYKKGTIWEHCFTCSETQKRPWLRSSIMGSRQRLQLSLSSCRAKLPAWGFVAPALY